MGLITEDTLSPLFEVPHSVPPPPLTAASPVLQSEPRTSVWTPRPISGGQKPSPNGSNWYPPPKSAESAFADKEPRWWVFFWPFGAVDSLPVALSLSSNLQASSDMVGQSLGCVAKLCLCIFETPQACWLLLVENCNLLTTWKFTAVFVLANLVAWSPLKVQRNIKSLYRNHKLHKSIKIVSLRGPQTILTVFGHSIWLSNELLKSTVFRSAIEHKTRNNKYRSNSRKCHSVVVIL